MSTSAHAFIREYIELRGGVEELDTKEKQALVEATMTPLASMLRNKSIRELFPGSQVTVVKDRSFGGGIEHELTVVRKGTKATVYQQAPENLNDQWIKHPELRATITKAKNGGVVIKTTRAHKANFDHYDTAAGDILLDAMLTPAEKKSIETAYRKNKNLIAMWDYYQWVT